MHLIKPMNRFMPPISFLRHALCAVSFALISLIVSGQGPQLAKVVPPSPTSQAFQKYGDIPVSAYTGIPDISIPIYTAKFRDISVPISLSYHASGIKVSEEASQVGLGWVLNAGGNISRNIVGLDDFDGNTYFNSSTNNIMDFSDGQGITSSTIGCSLPMFNRSIPQNPTLYNYDVTSYLTSVPAFDFQPDQYYYNFQGHSGKFVLKRNKQAVIQKQEKIQIIPASDGTSFKAITADGFTYDFAQYEWYHDNEFTTGGTASDHRTAWYLTKITSPVGNVVTFTYSVNSNYVQTVGGWSETQNGRNYPVANQTFPASIVPNSSGWNPGKQYNNLLLSTINFTNGKVVFNYSGGRVDLAGEKQLDSISIYEANASSPVKTFALTYGYFNGTTDPSIQYAGGLTDVVTKRLKLTQVTEKGYLNGQFIQNPPYTFTYNESGTLPAKTSFARDHWGYYNGVHNRTTLVPDMIPVNSSDPIVAAIGISGTQRDANAYFTPAFVLNTINYPTGGYTQFDFESNDFDETNSDVNDHSFTYMKILPAQKSQYFMYDIALGHDRSQINDTLDLTHEYVATDGSFPSTTVVADVRLSGGTGANCDDIQLPANVVYFELVNLSGGLLSHVDPGALSVCNAGGTNTPCVGCVTGQPVFSYTMTYQLAPGKYVWRYYVNTSSTYFSKLQDMKATYSWYEPTTTQTSIKGTQTPSPGTHIIQGGGLRVARVTDHDGFNENDNKVRHYIYSYSADKNNTGTPSTYSYGRRMSIPQYAFFTISADSYSFNTSTGCDAVPYYSWHMMRSSDSDVPLNGSAAGAVVGYDQVTELDGENGEFGKKVFQYINNPDIAGGAAERYTPFGLPVQPPYGINLVDITNGSLLDETDYVNNNGNFVRVREVTNQYSTVSNKENIVYGFMNMIPGHNDMGNVCGPVYPPGPCYLNEVIPYQSMKSDWNILTQTEEKLYDQHNAAAYEDKLTQYFYENPNHLQVTKTVTTDSKGGQIITRMQYPLDFTTVTGTDAFSRGVANLQNKFIVSTPVETYVQRSNSDGSNTRTINSVLTTFNASSPTPATISRTELGSPSTSFAATTTNSSGSVSDGSYKPLLSFDSYDGYGNILQQRKVNDMSTSYLWDYNTSLPVCEVKNAAQSDIAFTSFEADGTGGWTTSGGSIQSGGITGNNCFSFSGGNIMRSGLNPSTTYVVSFWSTNTQPFGISGTTSGYPIWGKRINGWSYYEYQITGQSSITISSTGSIDELRLYPATGQMKTLTYDPLVGVTSECDAGNKIVYYSYDALGRLHYLKDQDGNIVKTFEYHYKGQSGN